MAVHGAFHLGIPAEVKHLSLGAQKARVGGGCFWFSTIDGRSVATLTRS